MDSDILVGTPGCQLYDVINIICTSYPFQRWTNTDSMNLLKRLIIIPPTTHDLMMTLFTEIVSQPQTTQQETVSTILSSWVKISSEPKLDSLISALCDVGFADVASLLQTKVSSCVNSFTPIHPQNFKVGLKLQDETPGQATGNPEYQRLLSISSSETDGVRRRQNSALSVHQTKFFESDLENFDSKPHQFGDLMRKIANGWTIGICIFILLILMLYTIVVLMLGHWYIPNINTPNSLSSNQENLENMARILMDISSQYGVGKGNETTSIVAYNYNDYQKKVHHLPPFINLEVHLKLVEANAWPDDVPLQTSNQIRKLTLEGNLTGKTMLSILRETKNIEHLTLINSDDGLCDLSNSDIFADSHDTYNTVIMLAHLKAIRYQNFLHCSKIWEILSNYVYMKELQVFELLDGTVNKENVGYIEGFLANTKESLSTLKFVNTEWKLPIFDNTLFRLEKVTNVEMDFPLTGKAYIGRNFCYVFPNLLRFSSEEGYLSGYSYKLILECTTLTQLKMGVVLSPDETLFRMDFLRNAYQALKTVDLALLFPKKPRWDKCDVQGVDVERKRFEELNVGANCEINEI